MLRAILTAQWRIFWNHRPASGRLGRILALVLWSLWYGIWTAVAFAAILFVQGVTREALLGILPWALLGISAYWQATPVLTANLGASVDLKKLLLYPVPDSKLFLIDLVLRSTTSLEMVLLLGGIAIGLLRNPAVPAWAPLAGTAFILAFNLLLAVGLRSLMERLMGVRRLRELFVLVFILCAALPQLLTVTGVPRGVRRIFVREQAAVLPWTAAARLDLGVGAALSAAVLLAWIAAAYVFARRQFRRGLLPDAVSHTPGTAVRLPQGAGWAERLARLPSLVLHDPLGALLEKELKTLARSPRFRILFLMGFTFGMIIWLPMASRAGRVSENYPLFVSFYAAVLMAEVLMWNQFGLDRAASQLYFSTPVAMRQVLRAKNLASMLAIVLDITMVLLVCAALRVPLAGGKVLEAYLVTLVGCLYFLSAGNLSSLYQPRPVDPDQSWGRGSGSRFQWQLLVIFPALIAPISLAYLARYAFNSQAAFFAVLAFDALAGMAVYHVALDSAVRTAESRKEDILATLGRTSGPILTE
jgi:ABC-2 type transport system permease protein